jgi:Retinal pigment epithelial membrane protein
MEAFSIAAALATAVQERALIALHLLPTGHNPVRDAVSDYGVDPPFDVATPWDGYGPTILDRWIIDPAAGKVTQQTLDDRAQEFPRVDDRVISRPHRYGYGAMIGEVSQVISPLTGDFADEVFTDALLNMTGRKAPPRRTTSASKPPPAKPCSLQPRPRTTAMSSTTCTTPTAARRTFSSSPPRASSPSRWPVFTSRRPASAAAGSPTRIMGGSVEANRAGARDHNRRPQPVARRWDHSRPPAHTKNGEI